MNINKKGVRMRSKIVLLVLLVAGLLCAGFVIDVTGSNAGTKHVAVATQTAPAPSSVPVDQICGSCDFGGSACTRWGDFAYVNNQWFICIYADSPPLRLQWEPTAGP